MKEEYRLTVLIEKNLKHKLRMKCSKENKSMTEVVINLLDEWLKK